MKRFHVHLHVDDLGQSIGFYSKLFAAEPARVDQLFAAAVPARTSGGLGTWLEEVREVPAP